MDTAEDDNVVVALLRFLSQCKTVADIVGEVLYLVTLIIMPQYDSVFLFFQTNNFVFVNSLSISDVFM